jgi:membrane fusion protein
MESVPAANSPFRREALAAQRDRFQGEPPMAYPLTLRRLGWGTLGFVAVVLAFLSCTRYTQHFQASGSLRPSSGLIVHAAGQQGKVYFPPNVVQGAHLKRGAVLARLETSPSANAVSSLSDDSLDQLAAKRDGLLSANRVTSASAQARLATLNQQLSMVEVQAKSLRQQRELLNEKLRLKQAELERNAALEKSGYVSSQYVAAMRADAVALQASVAELEQRAAAVDQQGVALRQQALEIRGQADVDAAKVQQDVAEVNSRINAARSIRTVEIVAPRDLTVAALHVEPGNFVREETPILTTSDPGTEQDAVCLVEARAAVGLKPGTTVRLRYPAYPYQYFGTFEGKVLSVDSSPWQGRRDAERAGESGNDPVYRVVVHPSQQYVAGPQGRMPLMSGMAVQVEIPRSTRSLIEWLVMPARHL